MHKNTSGEHVGQLQGQLVELFVQLCANPDDATTATAADRTLTALEEALVPGTPAATGQAEGTEDHRG